MGVTFGLLLIPIEREALLWDRHGVQDLMCFDMSAMFRSAATMCAASVASACSRSTFEPFLVSLVSLSVEALASSRDDECNDPNPSPIATI